MIASYTRNLKLAAESMSRYHWRAANAIAAINMSYRLLLLIAACMPVLELVIGRMRGSGSYIIVRSLFLLNTITGEMLA